MSCNVGVGKYRTERTHTSSTIKQGTCGPTSSQYLCKVWRQIFCRCRSSWCQNYSPAGKRTRRYVKKSHINAIFIVEQPKRLPRSVSQLRSLVIHHNNSKGIVLQINHGGTPCTQQVGWQAFCRRQGCCCRSCNTLRFQLQVGGIYSLQRSSSAG